MKRESRRGRNASSVTARPEPRFEEFGNATASELAQEYGLTSVGTRPKLVAYTRELFRWLPFTAVLGSSQAVSKNRSSYLGQFWMILNPILNSLVYVIIFGLVLRASRGLTNAIAFIVVGTFMFRMFSDIVNGAARSVLKNRPLLTALRFPRAVLPLSVIFTKWTTVIPELIVMLGFVLVSGLVPSATPVVWGWSVLLLIPALALMYVFALGVGFFVARIVAFVPDLINVISFVLRFVMYGSGVLFPVAHYVHDPQIQQIVNFQPVAVYLNLMRQAVLSEPTIPTNPSMWLWGIGWAIGTLVLGYVFFWRAETRYGRE